MTLTEAAFWTKRFSVVIIGFLAVMLIMIIIVLAKSANPPPPPEYVTPNCACTKTRDDFLENALTIPSLDLLPDTLPTYEVQTDTGKLDDDLPSVVNVYRYTNLGQYLDSQAQAKILAKKMGFNPEAIIRRGTTEYIWYDGVTGKSLVVNARDLNFTMSTEIEKIKALRKQYDLPSEVEAKSIAMNTIRSLGVMIDGFNDVPPLSYLVSINPDGTYSQADSLLNADLIRIDLHRKIPMLTIRSDIVGAEAMVSSLTRRDLSYDIGSMIINDSRVEVYNFSTLLTYQNPNKSNVSVYIGPKDRDAELLENVYQIDYKAWSLEPVHCGTYPVIPASIAKDKVENGEGSIVFINYDNDQVKPYVPQDVLRFLITSVNITYFEGPLEQKYLQPVYLFGGQAELKNGTRADFHIYYPALNYEIVTDEIILEAAPIKEKGGPFSL